MGALDSRRIRDPLLILPILAGRVFGLAPLLAPARFGDAGRFASKDRFLHRLAVAANVGHGVALLVGFRSLWVGVAVALRPHGR